MQKIKKYFPNDYHCIDGTCNDGDFDTASGESRNGGTLRR